MNRKNKQMLESIRKDLGAAMDNTDVPEKLHKDSIVELIERKGVKNAPAVADSSGKVLQLYRVTALVAALTITVVCALCVQLFRESSPTVSQDGVDIVLGEIRNARNYDEIKNIIIGRSADDKTQGSAGNSSTSQTQITASQKPAEQSTLPNRPAEIIPSITDSLEGIVGIEYDGAGLVKADGEYIYIATSSRDKKTGRDIPQMLIIKAYPLDSMELISTISIPGEDNAGIADKIVGIHLADEKMIVLIDRVYSGDPAGKRLESVSVMYDIADKAAPVMQRELVQDGSYVKSMILNNRLYMVSSYSVSVQADTNASAESYIPTYTKDGISHLFNANKIYCGVTNPESSYLVITTADIADPDSAVGTQAILGCGSEIYFSANKLVATRQYTQTVNGSKEQYTELYCFDITDDGIKFQGSNVVEGVATDIISVDECDGSIKIAVNDTVGKAIGDSVYIFSDKMKKVSRYAYTE